MRVTTGGGLRGLVLVLVIGATAAGAQGGHGDSEAMLQFQRAADAYAFIHRQHERRDTPQPPSVEGAIFTPLAGNAFRARLRIATSPDGCAPPAAAGKAPGVNAAPGGAVAVPPCYSAVLPALPDELEYRMAGEALLLVDRHRQVVVDVLPAAFPSRDN